MLPTSQLPVLNHIRIHATYSTARRSQDPPRSRTTDQTRHSHRSPAVQCTDPATRTHEPLLVTLRRTRLADELAIVDPPDIVTLLAPLIYIAAPFCSEASEHK